MEKYTVLTYIIGDYEVVHPILEKSEHARYILVTDNPNLIDTSDSWEIIYDKELTGSTFDRCYQIRFNPFKYAKTDICIRLDGSMTINKPLDKLVKKFTSEDYDMSLMIHPTRPVMYDEYVAWVQARQYPLEQANKCLSYMAMHGYDVKNYKGMYQMCYEICKNNKVCNDWHRLSYATLKMLGDEESGIERVDQTITSYILNKDFSHAKVMWVDQRITFSEFITWCAHGTLNPLLFGGIKDMKEPYAFNKRLHNVVRPDDL